MHTSNVTIRSPSPPDTLADDLSKVSGSVSLPRRVSSTCCISREGGRVGERESGFPATSSLHMHKKESSTYTESQLGPAYRAT